MCTRAFTLYAAKLAEAASALIGSADGVQYVCWYLERIARTTQMLKAPLDQFPSASSIALAA
jgi:hypothetical protein